MISIVRICIFKCDLGINPANDLKHNIITRFTDLLFIGEVIKHHTDTVSMV